MVAANENDGTVGRRGMPAASVVVVGGGISGCACASNLASLGVRVLVLSSALDSVGQPSFGPDLLPVGTDERELQRILDSLNPSLRTAWVAAATKGGTERSGVAVDRRMLSVEAKRGLEDIPGLHFRQGLVVAVAAGREYEEAASSARTVARRGPRQRMVVETAFGEVVEGHAVVVAVGLALGGLVHTGDEVREGGRYGETPASGLRKSLERLGASWRRVEARVGARYCSQDAWRSPLAEAHRGKVLGRTEEDAGLWPADFPPAPQWDEELRHRDFARVGEGRPDGGSCDGPKSGPESAGTAWALWPDGTATGEMYALPESPVMLRGRPETTLPTRPEQWITGLAVDNLGFGGRLGGDRGDRLPVWVIGRAGGARDYLESLTSGVRAAEEIAEFFGKRPQGSDIVEGECDGSSG